MRFKKGDERREKRPLARPGTKLACLDSGHVEEPARTAFVGQGSCKCGKSDDVRVVWRPVRHGLLMVHWVEGSGLAKILIVEDNALNIKLFCDLLAAHGHQPEAVTDSRQALDAAHDLDPDLVITDIQLPHVTGLDLIRMIRADEQLSEVPIMAVTAYSATGDEERIRAAGAQAYVAKPISVVRFADTVEQLLKPGPPMRRRLVRGRNERSGTTRAQSAKRGKTSSNAPVGARPAGLT